MHLHKVNRTDDKGAILLSVTPKRAESDPVSMMLYATEGVCAYKLHLKHKKLADFKTPNYNGSDSELEEILLYALLDKVPQNPSNVLGVGLAARVEESLDEDTGDMMVDRIFVQVKKEIPGVRTVLAELKLSMTQDAVSIFDWAVQACAERDSGKEEVAKVKEERDKKDRTIESLTSQLDRMTKLKEEHEEQLMGKFKALLDTKKRKIRELHSEIEKLQGGAGPADEDAEMAEPSPEPPKRTTRRKAASKAPSPPAPATRTRSKTTAKQPSARTGNMRKRKPVTDAETEEESDGGFAPVRSGASGKMAATQLEDTEDGTEEDVPQMSDQRDTDDEELPPVRRPIGFGEKESPPKDDKKDAAKDQGGDAAGEEDGEETEDDEL